MRAPRYAGERRTSLYLVVRDGVRLAVDVWLPAGLETGARIPTMLQQTRYFRGAHYTTFGRLIGAAKLLDMGAPGRRYFVSRGYAWVHVCVRGSGASTGVRPYPWSVEEVEDGREVVDWIVAQPWSNGLVASTGVSYDGTAAEMLLRNQHPAVKAVVPRFSLFDVYADVAYPGGVHLEWFTSQWGRFNRALDENRHGDAITELLRHNLRATARFEADARAPVRAALFRGAASERFAPALGAVARALTRGVRPVDGDPLSLDGAIAEHRGNYDVHSGALRLVSRDDVGLSSVRPDDPVDAFSPHHFASEIAASGTPIYSYSGWWDAGYPASATARFRTIRTPGSRLVLGPWDHGGGQNASPWRAQHAASFDHDAELFRFVDPLVGGDTAPAEGAPVRYFVMGAEQWREAADWPPPGRVPRTLFLERGRLAELQPQGAAGSTAPAGSTELKWSPTLGTGERSRWRTLIGVFGPVGYARPPLDESIRPRFLSAPFGSDTVLTGSVIVHLRLSCSQPDAAVFAYLELVAPDGAATIVTEGQLRLLHRHAEPDPGDPLALPRRSFESRHAEPMEPGRLEDVSFAMLPTSVQVPAGHRVALALALGDADHFRAVCPRPHSVRVAVGSGSRIVLPIEAT